MREMSEMFSSIERGGSATLSPVFKLLLVTVEQSPDAVPVGSVKCFINPNCFRG